MFRDIYFYWKTMQKYRLRKRFYREPETWVKKVLKWNPSLELSICLFCIVFPINSWQFYLLLMVNLILNLHLYLSNKNRKTCIQEWKEHPVFVYAFTASWTSSLWIWMYTVPYVLLYSMWYCTSLSNVYSAVTVMPGSDMKCFPWPNTAETLR